MQEIDNEELKATLKDAGKYVATLLVLQKDLSQAENQIVSSSETTVKVIECFFENLAKQISEKLKEREDKLINEAKKVSDNSLAPISSSKKVIDDKIMDIQSFIKLSQEGNISFEDFSKSASNLASLPQVPQLKEVSCLTFQHDSKLVESFLQQIGSLGTVLPIAPVQISSIIQKPGALLVQWEVLETTDETFSEIQEFHLQQALGNATIDEKHLQFHEAYKGTELQFLSRDLRPKQDYTFRVRCKFESCNYYSPWSALIVCNTLLEPYTWQESNENFELSNNSKICANLVENATLLSKGAQFKQGDSIEFTILECGDILKDSFIGLLAKPINCSMRKRFLIQPNESESFILEATGNIYINGAAKLTVLPKVTRNSKITFTSIPTPNDDEKLRLSIDIGNKRVTYDWNIDISSGFYFVTHMRSGKWKILVE